jgi:hypothetical protein
MCSPLPKSTSASPLNQKSTYTIAYYIIFTALGMLLASLGPSLPYLANELSASIGQKSYLTRK